MKRLLVLGLVFCLLFAIAPARKVSAEEAFRYGEAILPTYEKNAGPHYEVLAQITDMTALRACLDENLAACRQIFDISAYGVHRSKFNDLALYIYKDVPTSFHVSGISYDYYLSSGIVANLYVSYSISQSEYNAYLDACYRVAAEMTKGLDHPGLTDADKALILHDRLAVHNEYDLSLNAPFTGEMVGALVNRTSVCEGYAMAYSFLLDQVGIRNYYVTSDVLNHGWNMVYIDGVKYHVDVTWDDPSYDQLGYVQHNNFLRSSQGMLETRHHEEGVYDFDTSATDTRYDNAYWQKSNTAVQVIDGTLYYADTSHAATTKLIQVKNGVHSLLADITATFPSSYGLIITGFQKLASDGQDLLYSAGNKVYRYCLKSGTAEVIWQLSLPSDQSIFGFVYENETLVAVPFSRPDFEIDTNHTARVTKAYTPHEHGALIKGDIDGNGQVEVEDAIDLLYHVCFPEIYSTNQPSDFDGSGVVDMDDAIYLLYYVNFPTLYPLH